MMHIIYFKILLQGHWLSCSLLHGTVHYAMRWGMSWAADEILSHGTTYVLRRKQLETLIRKAVILQIHTNII